MVGVSLVVAPMAAAAEAVTALQMAAVPWGKARRVEAQQAALQAAAAAVEAVEMEALMAPARRVAEAMALAAWGQVAEGGLDVT